MGHGILLEYASMLGQDDRYVCMCVCVCFMLKWAYMWVVHIARPGLWGVSLSCYQGVSWRYVYLLLDRYIVGENSSFHSGLPNPSCCKTLTGLGCDGEQAYTLLPDLSSLTTQLNSSPSSSSRILTFNPD
ncbi:hypothetical protein T440DRAFT_222205 [Plenodomus tracheiphilus IPT5]|uniref:Uncharacterized protein n=1 Tax=Plenodomus tracheiphilus IPT5 TaxID=1408161 RepID=A0A6A7AUE7_9PLEO|nr:hypothetical protein T440DRAFT_222205 [Plenodomus tracheiphilus IPT5]